jgi:hypothetical protein
MLIAVLALSGAALAQTSSRQPGVEVQAIVTVADHMNHKPPALKADDVKIMNATITDWIPPADGRDLELFVLIDDAANYDFGAKLQELRRFVAAQPAPVSVGVAYIHDGALQIAENPTTDHARAARALRAPSGSKTANMYCSLSDLMQRWPENSGPQKSGLQQSLRREILMVGTGIDDSANEAAVCVTAETAIRDAERAGIVLYAMYNPMANYLSEKWEKVDSGLIDLAHVCFETGGEAYFMSHNPVDSIEPFLEDVAEHLAHQYVVKFRLSPGPESGFQAIYLSAGSPRLELMVPAGVWVPAPAE